MIAWKCTGLRGKKEKPCARRENCLRWASAKVETPGIPRIKSGGNTYPCVHFVRWI